jgi:hypothetical protein
MKPFPIIAFAVTFIASMLRSVEPASPAELVDKIDRILRPEKSFAVTAQATTFKDRTVAAAMTVKAFVRVQPDGSLDSLAIITEPEADRGKVYLRKAAGDLWFFDPKAARPVRISAQQRFQGQSSIDDLMNVNLRQDYSARIDPDESVTDVAGKEQKARRLHFVASTKSAPYPAVDLWVDRDNYHPIKVTSLSAGGRALKTAYYDKFRGFLGQSRPTEITIVDEIHPGTVSRVRFSDFDTENLATGLFQESFMPEAGKLLKRKPAPLPPPR